MKIGLSSAAYYGQLETDESAAHIAELPLDTCEVFLETPSEYTTDFTFRMRYNMNNFHVTSVHPLGTQFEPQLFGRAARQSDDAFAMFANVCRAAESLGAAYYIFHGPFGVRGHLSPANIPFLEERFDQMREREGEKLAEDVRNRASVIETLVGEVEKRSPERVAEYREKLLARMREVLESTDIDETRIVTEAAIYADKTAVDEETVRLRSHLHQLDGMLNEVKPVGRKLDFLVQEMNREANTIGSKANDVEMAQTVVNIKSEIEKIREQIQNIE